MLALKRLINSVRELPQKYWRQKVSTAIRVAVFTVAFVVMVFAGYYAIQAYMHQQKVLAKANLKRIEIDQIDLHDTQYRLTEAKINRIADRVNAAFAYPKKQVSVKLSINGNSQYVAMEGAVGSEPELQSNQLIFGRPFSRDSKPTIIISQGMLARLGGSIGNITNVPVMATIQVTRTSNGILQTQQFEAMVLGVAEGSETRIFAPLDVALNLDRWQTHKSDNLNGGQTESDVPFDYVEAYVPVDYRDQLQSESQRLNVDFRRIADVVTMNSFGEVWAEVVELPNRVVELGSTDSTESMGGDGWQTWTIQKETSDGNVFTGIALANDDPRWHLNGLSPERSLCISMNPDFIPMHYKSVLQRSPLVGLQNSDFLTTHQSVLWDEFRRKDWGFIEQQRLIHTSDIKIAAALERQIPGCITVDDPFSFTILELEVMEKDAHRLLNDIVNEYQFRAADLHLVRAGTLDVKKGGRASKHQEAALPVRLVPLSLIAKIAGKSKQEITLQNRIPIILAGGNPDFARMLEDSNVSEYKFLIVGSIRSNQLQLWLPLSNADLPNLETLPVGLVCWGEWEAVHLASNQLRASLPELKVSSDRWPSRFRAIVKADEDLRWLKKENVSQFTFFTMKSPSTIRQTIALKIMMIPDHNQDIDQILVQDKSTDQTILVALGQSKVECSVGASDLVPKNHALVASELFEELGFQYALQNELIPKPDNRSRDVRFPNVLAYRVANNQLYDFGMTLELRTPLVRNRFVKYRVERQLPNHLNATLVSRLHNAKPTIRYVKPRLEIKADFRGLSSTIWSHNGVADPVWFELDLVVGNLTDRSSAIVLSKSVADHSFPSQNYHDLIGRTVYCNVSSVKHDAQSIAIPMEIMAISTDDRSFVSMPEIRNWRQWQMGDFEFDDATSTFQTPGAVYDNRGFVSAVLYAKSEKSVETIVRSLEGMGFKVRHQLNQQRQLAELGWALIVLVLMFVSGALLNGMFNSGAISWMDLSFKLKEIGIKMAYGLTRKDIVLAYVAENLIISIIACSLGTLAILVGEPILRVAICNSVGLTDEFFIISVFAPSVTWLYLIAFVVVAFFNVLGAIIPTWLALGKTPTELLK